MKTIFSFILAFLSFFILSAQESGGPYITDENTVLLMHFDGDATNSSGVGINGISHGSGVSYESGVHGQALRLDNSTFDKQSWIEVPYFKGLNATSDGLAVECWFKINSWGENENGVRSLFHKDGESWIADYEIILSSELASGRQGQANMNCEDEQTQNWAADAPIADILELNKWYFIVLYYSPSLTHVCCLIRDENFEEIFASRGYSKTPPTNSTGLFRIGFGGSSESYFDGWIDELRISNSYRKYRDDVLAGVDVNSFKDSVFIPLKDSWTSYGWPLGEYYPVDPVTGEVSRQNACGPTMLARGIHYWEYPRFPEGVIEHNWEGLYWYANYDEEEYLWDQMRSMYTGDETAEELDPVEVFGAQVGVASLKTFDNMYCMPKFLKENFLFSKRTRIVFEEEYSKEDWENIIRNELNNGRICMVGGWGHYYIINGYNSKNQFFTDYSFNDIYWNDIKDFDYGDMQDMIIYFEPDWGNKVLELEHPKTGDLFQKGGELEIKWSSQNISSLIIEYSSDAGYNWHTIADNVDANLASYTYTLPDTNSDDYRIRISDKENLNVYRKSSGINIYTEKEFAFTYPKLNTKFKKGTKQPVYWQSAGINNCRLEYSIENSTWSTLSDSMNVKAGFILIDLPDIKTENIKLRAIDINEPENIFVSETFHLIPDQLFGGPYEHNDETLLLMHFENDVLNYANTTLLPFETAPICYYEANFEKHLGKAYRNVNGDNVGNALIVKNSENIDLGINWTIEAWVKVASVMGERTVASLVVNKWDAFNISAGWQHFGAEVFFENGSSIGFGTSQQYELNKWYHVALISSADDQKIYFLIHDEDYHEVCNKEQNFPEGSNGQIAANENLLTIGGLGGASNLELDGWLDEIRITRDVVDYNSMTVGTNQLISYNSDINLTCYPNPISANSIISFNNVISGNVTLSIYDIRGNKILTLLDKKLSAGSYTTSLSKLSLTSGIYFCTLSSKNGSSTIKLIAK